MRRAPTRLAMIVILALVLAMWPRAEVPANAGARECGLGGGTRAGAIRLARCLSHVPGIRVRTSYAVGTAAHPGILLCEGANITDHTGPYYGPWQLMRAEFSRFPHTGPRWVMAEFRRYHYGIMSARGQTLAVYAWAQHHGWGWSSCA